MNPRDSGGSIVGTPVAFSRCHLLSRVPIASQATSDMSFPPLTAEPQLDLPATPQLEE